MPDTQQPTTHGASSEVATDLFEKLDKVLAGMLGVEGSGAHMQPMTHFADPDRGTLWFLTSRDTDLARQVGQGGTAHYCVVDGEDRYYACLRGTIRQSGDSAKVDELWSPVVAAWFAGRDDPDILLLEMSLRDAEVWTSTDSRVQFGLEIARANLDEEHMPDVGERHVIKF